ncbi:MULTISPECIES: hypothetical protein [unclassified Bradyrhizobium]|nr:MULTISPECIES: hypothetical protein [unclassified Bradyrhizobium]
MSSTGAGRRSSHEGVEEIGVDEAIAFIAETTESLARLARRHDLDMLDYILRMARLEAEEHWRRRDRRTLS